MSKKVVTVTPEDTMKMVVQKMSSHEFSALPVVEGKDLVGIVTEADVIGAIDAFGPKMHFDTGTSFELVLTMLRKGKRFEGIKKEVVESTKLKVREFMKPHPWTVGPEDSIEDAARMMVQKGVKVIPVVKGTKLVGVLARADIVRALSR